MQEGMFALCYVCGMRVVTKGGEGRRGNEIRKIIIVLQKNQKNKIVTSLKCVALWCSLNFSVYNK